MDYIDIYEHQQVKLVAYKLRGGASALLENLLVNRRREGNGMKQLMKAKFLPADYDKILYQQHHQCQQKGKTVNEYSEEFSGQA